MNHREEIDQLLDDECYLEVEEWTTELIESGTEYDWAHFKRGVARYGMRLYQEAFEDFDLVVNYNDRSASAATNRGLSMCRLHDYHGAETDFRRAIAIDESYDHAWVCLGDLLHNYLNRWDESLQVFNQAISRNPESEAWSYRGDLFLDMNRLEEAEADAIESLRLFPEDAHSVLFFGEVQSAFGHRSLFYEYLEKAIEMDPDVLEDVNPSVIQRHILEKRFQALVMRHLEGKI